MDYLILIGCILTLALLTPAMVRALSHAMNRRLARKLATGPVGVLLRHDYPYAMELSNMVSEGNLSVAEASELADNWIHMHTDIGSISCFGISSKNMKTIIGGNKNG